MLALGVPSSSLSRIVPAVAEYLISCPPILSVCLVGTLFSSGTGGFFSSFGFSAGFSPGFSADVCDCGCCPRQRFAPRRSATRLKNRKEVFINEDAPHSSAMNAKRDVRHRMRESRQRQSPASNQARPCSRQIHLHCTNSPIKCAHDGKIAKERFMRRIFLTIIVSWFLVSAASAPAAPQAEQKKEELPHPKTLEELQKAMKDVVDKRHVTGAGVALVSNGQVLWCGGIGKADLAANHDIQCDTEFRVGSISKSFVALALLKLQEEAKINLYARLQDVAPEIPVKNRWESSNPVRIVNLLEHTAGFDDMAPSEVYNRHDRADFPLLDVFKRFQEPQQV